LVFGEAEAPYIEEKGAVVLFFAEVAEPRFLPEPAAAVLLVFFFELRTDSANFGWICEEDLTGIELRESSCPDPAPNGFVVAGEAEARLPFGERTLAPTERRCID